MYLIIWFSRYTEDNKYAKFNVSAKKRLEAVYQSDLNTL